ncbi:MAG: NAD(P)/FAD-dependent oxidoreductase, partial [Candidatus Thorarchaeota archaeon]
SSGCKVSVESLDGFGTIAAQMVIDASGVTPVSSKTSCVRSRLPNDRVGYAVQYQMRVPGTGLGDVNDFYYGGDYSPRGYAWVFPRANEVAVGTGGIVSGIKVSSRRTSEYLDYLISQVEPVRTELEGATIIKKEAALMPLAGISRPSYANRVLLVGDAAAHCSPISGEGIRYAMVAGHTAAKIAANAVKTDDYSARSLSGYEKQWTKAIGSDLKWGLWLQKRFTDSGSASMGSRFLKSEKARRIIAEMLVGERSVMSAIKAALPGYLVSRIR